MENADNYILNKINSPADLRKLNIKELPELCNELRSYIIKELAENPGHLGSNLGTIELTVALHYTLNTPDDLIVWDVGHQAYAHKILTGRREAFHNNRKFKGISGFPNPNESIYDSFIAGHASNSISAALGMSIASSLKKENRIVTAVIGDGSLTGGLAYEGLNNASIHPNNLLIILNDNHMAIDKNVGGMSNYLTNITTSFHYNNIRWKLFLLLRKLGLINKEKKNQLITTGNKVKSFLAKQHTIFDGLNIRYFGPIDGHNVEKMIKAINSIKYMSGPKILHVYTKKGKGYAPAEENATQWHAPGKFDIKTGKRIVSPNNGSEPLKFQEVFGHTLLELADRNEKIVGITPAMPTGCCMNLMKSRYPERTFDVGIAEGHAITFSAGLAKMGMIPFCNIYSSFAQRSLDNIIHDVAILKLPVILCLDRAGLVGEDGPTHHGVFDIPTLRCVPNLILSSPIDEHQLRDLMYTAEKTLKGPFIIRYPKGKGYCTNWKNEMKSLPIGKAECLIEGNGLAVLTTGPIGKDTFDIITELNKNGYSVALYNFIFIKPLDEELLHYIGKSFNKIITIENGALKGGFGSGIDEFFSDNNYSVEIKRMGIPDHFIEHGAVCNLMKLCGLDKESITESIVNMYKQ